MRNTNWRYKKSEKFLKMNNDDEPSNGKTGKNKKLQRTPTKNSNTRKKLSKQEIAKHYSKINQFFNQSVKKATKLEIENGKENCIDLVDLVDVKIGKRSRKDSVRISRKSSLGKRTPAKTGKRSRTQSRTPSKRGQNGKDKSPSKPKKRSKSRSKSRSNSKSKNRSAKKQSNPSRTNQDMKLIEEENARNSHKIDEEQGTSKEPKEKEPTLDIDPEDFEWCEKSFALTGLFKSNKDRKRIAEVLRKWGMVSRSSVSRRTGILIHGYVLEDGRDVQEAGKYKKAVKFGTEILSESDVDQKIQAFTGFSIMEHIEALNCPDGVYPHNLLANRKEFGNEVDLLNHISQNGDVPEKIIEEGQIQDSEKQGNEDKNKNEKPKETLGRFNILKGFEGKLWADLFAPKISRQLIGNGGAIRQLRDWLKTFKGSQRQEYRKAQAQKGGFSKFEKYSENLYFVYISEVTCTHIKWADLIPKFHDHISNYQAERKRPRRAVQRNTLSSTLHLSLVFRASARPQQPDSSPENSASKPLSKTLQTSAINLLSTPH